LTKSTILQLIPVCLMAGSLSSIVLAADPSVFTVGDSVSSADTRILSAKETRNSFSYSAPTKQIDDDDILQRIPIDIYMESVPKNNEQLQPSFRAQTPTQLKTNRKATIDSDTEALGSMSQATAYTPLCSTLSINTAYSLNGTVPGGQYCFHFEVTERAKTEAFLIGQAASTDFALTLLRHEDDGSFTYMGGSDLAGNANESVLALTEYGQYYWLLDANSSDGSAITFGAAVNTAADSHELNDSVAMATVLADGRNVVYGNMDGATDVDYFLFTSLRGQNVEINLDDFYGSNEWIIEIWNGAWSPVTVRTRLTSSSGFDVYARVRPNPLVGVNPTHDYVLTFGSIIDHIGNIEVEGEPNLARITYTYWSSPYMTTQAHNLLEWSVRVFDSSNEPLSGVTAKFAVGTTDIPASYYTAISDSNGTASGIVTLPDCYGAIPLAHRSFGPGGQNWWASTFNLGAWAMTFPESMIVDEVGVGGENVPAVILGHICTQKLLP
jgi:hypothetical protein